MRNVRRGVTGANDAGGRIDAIDPSTGWKFSLVRGEGVAWDHLHSALTSTGIHLPVESCSGFPVAGRDHRVLICVSDADGQIQWGGVADVGHSRVVPWRTIVRVHRFGRGVPGELLGAVTGSLSLVCQLESVLRIHIEVSEPDADARSRITEALHSRGYKVVSAPRLYGRTILLDLDRTETELLASFHATGRRHIRGFAKHPLRCEAITGQRYVDRLHALDAETMQRTNGSLDSFSWHDVLRFVAEHPTQAILFGVLRTDVPDEAALVGYVLGVRHGDTVEYRRAASTRLSDLRAPLLYAPTWQLMCWGKALGARWFDFGGIGDGTHSSGAATGGISDFKRYFSEETTEIGTELTFSPAMHLDTLVRTLATSAGRLKRALGRG